MRKINSLILTIVICLILSSCFEDSLKIISHPAYAIGSINYYKPSGGNGTSYIDFGFAVGINQYHVAYQNGDYRWNVPLGCSSCGNGSKYMVQYDSLNPSTARMVFSYPVHDSTDYKNDVTLFKKNPPGYPHP